MTALTPKGNQFTYPPNACLWMWEQSGVPGENLRRHGEETPTHFSTPSEVSQMSTRWQQWTGFPITARSIWGRTFHLCAVEISNAAFFQSLCFLWVLKSTEVCIVLGSARWSSVILMTCLQVEVFWQSMLRMMNVNLRANKSHEIIYSRVVVCPCIWVSYGFINCFPFISTCFIYKALHFHLGEAHLKTVVSLWALSCHFI